MILLNAFSLNMLAAYPAQPRFIELSLKEVKEAIASGVESGVGHADTAAVFADTIGIDVPMNRMTVSLKKGDVAIIGQYRGPRLPEGCKTLPEGASIQWIKLEV
jgi:hypothetical protein